MRSPHRPCTSPTETPAHREVAEEHNALLPPHYLKKFYKRPCRPHVPIRRLSLHTASARCRLAPRNVVGFPHTLQSGVSVGLVQGRCGLLIIKITLLHQLLVLQYLCNNYVDSHMRWQVSWWSNTATCLVLRQGSARHYVQMIIRLPFSQAP